MCCFSRPVKVVAGTNIFARAMPRGRQAVVYSMSIDADEPLAMILPIPVPKNSPENAVKFINLKEYENFFDELSAGFPEPVALAAEVDSRKQTDDAPKLLVEQVGDFEASFVPSIKDFSRLDERFRLPTDVWNDLPMYKDFGFAVFQLLKEKTGAQKVHPMAFIFPRANPRRLFFPTVHIHDGEVHPKADFDHMLYCQASAGENLMMWDETPRPAGMFMANHQQSQGIIDPDAHCYRRIMIGEFDNEDTLV